LAEARPGRQPADQAGERRDHTGEPQSKPLVERAARPLTHRERLADDLVGGGGAHGYSFPAGGRTGSG
jgi:hypothetical protein